MKKSKIYQFIQNLKDLRTKNSITRLFKQNLDKNDKEITKPLEPRPLLKNIKRRKKINLKKIPNKFHPQKMKK